MITTAESLRQGFSTISRVKVYLTLSLAFSVLVVFADDGSSIRATHVLGLEGIANNAGGNLSIRDGALQFRVNEGPAAQIGIASMISASPGEEDKQVGGVPMALGRAATPFGGGRVIGLFSHKKYDTLTVEYLDANGGLRGAIFQLNKSQAQTIKNELVADGAHFAELKDHGAELSATEVKNENK